jgi:hypothetical protein
MSMGGATARLSMVRLSQDRGTGMGRETVEALAWSWKSTSERDTWPGKCYMRGAHEEPMRCMDSKMQNVRSLEALE